VCVRACGLSWNNFFPVSSVVTCYDLQNVQASFSSSSCWLAGWLVGKEIPQSSRNEIETNTQS